jgi:hypothetical protein
MIGYRQRQMPDAPGAAGRGGTETATEEAKKPAAEDRILCRACLHTVTREAERLAVDGSHRHTFANPSGMVFEVGCFRQAPGCVAVGPPSAEFTWFAGHTWRVGICAACQIHLGWRFLGATSAFYALILDRLLTNP